MRLYQNIKRLHLENGCGLFFPSFPRSSVGMHLGTLPRPGLPFVETLRSGGGFASGAGRGRVRGFPFPRWSVGTMPWGFGDKKRGQAGKGV
jgi:hypothetical protein